MKIHDWTRVTAGTFHDFHCAWITHIKEALNFNLLPNGYYAMAEQHAGNLVPDILALTSAEWIKENRVESNRVRYATDSESASKESVDGQLPSGALALAEFPPQVSLRSTCSEEYVYRERRRTITVRQEPNGRVVAMIEIVSPGNKDGSRHMSEFVSKSLEVMQAGIHLLVVDLFPPNPCNPDGIHALLWDEPFTLPADRRLTLVSYRIDRVCEAFIEPAAVGQPLPDMPIFLAPDWYINVPLSSTYESAWRGLPAPFQDVLEAV